MKINVVQIPDSGLNLTFSKDGDWFRALLPETGEGDCALQRVDVSCTVKKSHESLIIEGTLEIVVEAACSRCLEPVRQPVQGEFRYVLVPKPEQAGKLGVETTLDEDDLDLGYYEGEIIDLDPLIFEQTVLQIPIKVLCEESCRGLCPRCGANLNAEGCGCPVESPSGKLAALKNFRVKEKN